MELSQGRKVDVEAGGRTASGGGGGKELQRKSPGDDDDEDDEGTRQPYNCTFCKRGFPTAQALGGHMNVHRKDRGRATPAMAAAGAGYETLVAFMATGYGQTSRPASGSQASTAAGGSLHHAEERAPQELRLFSRDCGVAGRGKEGGGSDPRECYGKDGGGDDDEDEGEEELDLELRLGGAAGS